MKKYKLYALTEPDNIEIIRYIGITKKSLLVRLGQHLGKSEERTTRRDEWISTLDISPRIILLDSFDTYKEALKFEKETITKFELNGITLYNEQGNFNRRNICAKEVHQYELNGSYIRSYKSAREADALNMFFNYKNISGCCNGNKKSHYGYMFSFIKKDKINPIAERAIRRDSKEIHQYTKDNIYIQSFPNAYKASEKLKLRVGDIWKAANNFKNTITCGGYKWSYDKV